MHRNKSNHYSLNPRFNNQYNLQSQNRDVNNVNYTYARKRGCYNCGEFNHHSSNCRYDHKIRCNVCSALGHKSRLWMHYSNY